MVDAANRRAQYANLMTCASVWFCPVCASRITEKRAMELSQAVQGWQQGSGFVALLTFTLAHHKGDRLPVVLDALRDSHRRFKSGAPFQRMSERYGWQGSVTALEVTHGANGWHPHLHELVFFDPVSTASWVHFVTQAKERWIKALAASHRGATFTHGLDIRTGDQDIADYVTKFGHLPAGASWTIDREVAKSPVKVSRSDTGRSAFQLLWDFAEGDQYAGDLFREYARAFKGRKQLVWSRGLRDMLGMDADAGDEQIAAAVAPEMVLLAALSPVQWRQILALRVDLRGHLLEVAAQGDKSKFEAFLGEHGIT